jgi:hypothetical protein
MGMTEQFMEHVADTFEKIDGIVAVFGVPPTGRELHFWAVARQHGDVDFSLIVQAEDHLTAVLGGDVTIHLRAHQDRPASDVVPAHTEQLFTR